MGVFITLADGSCLNVANIERIAESRNKHGAPCARAHTKDGSFNTLGTLDDVLKELAPVIPAAPGWHFLIAFEPEIPSLEWTASAETIVGWRVTHLGFVEPLLVSGFDADLTNPTAIRAPDGVVHMYDGLFDDTKAWLAFLTKKDA